MRKVDRNKLEERPCSSPGLEMSLLALRTFPYFLNLWPQYHSWTMLADGTNRTLFLEMFSVLSCLVDTVFALQFFYWCFSLCLQWFSIYDFCFICSDCFSCCCLCCHAVSSFGLTLPRLSLFSTSLFSFTPFSRKIVPSSDFIISVFRHLFSSKCLHWVLWVGLFSRLC